MADLFGTVASVASSLLGLGGDKKVWRLKMLDTPETEFVGQYVAENPTENIGHNSASVGGVGVTQPTPQFLSGQQETFTFGARVFGENTFQNIHDKVVLLKSFAKKREDLNRPPIFTFTFGTELAFRCFVTGLGGIVYDDPREDGSLRGARFQITLTKIEDIPTEAQAVGLAALIKFGIGAAASAAGALAQIGVIDVPGGSLKRTGRVHVVKEGETFEAIAQREYGAALRGDILRRAHPELRVLKPNDRVQLIVKADVLRTKVTQQSVMLKDEIVVTQRKTDLFAKRGVSKIVFL